MVDLRRAVELLLELSSDAEDCVDAFDAQLDDTAIELLTMLCNSLTIAVAAARGRSARRSEARGLAVECAAGIDTVLDVWRSNAVEIVDGPFLGHSGLATPLYD